MYISTRGGVTPVSASAAIYGGLAADGGLFVPCEFPPVPDLASLTELTYPQLAAEIMAPYLDDFSRSEVENICRVAYGDNFDAPDKTPLHGLSGNRYVLELHHGPTAAFKDMALQILPHLLRASMQKQQIRQEVVILVATSGDTGKAALDGFANVPGVRIIVFYPAAGVSEVQRLQMITTLGDNTSVVAVHGNFDDCQRNVKAIFNDAAFRAEMEQAGFLFSSANSINWGRLLPQIVYYFKAYSDLVKKGALQVGEKMDVVVPTGNFGNILACYYGMRIGLPVNGLICASNRNRILTDVITTGVYDRRREFFRTSSPSMDILVSSNFERFLFEMTGRDSATIRQLFQRLEAEGVYTLEPVVHQRLRAILHGYDCDETQTVRAIGDTWMQEHYLIDTHTAVAVHALEAFRAAGHEQRPAVIASTADPYKFNVSVYEALQGRGSAADKDEFTVAAELAAVTNTTIHRALRDLQTREIRHRLTIDPEAMTNTVRRLLTGSVSGC